MIEIVNFTLGPVQTNAYLVADNETLEAAVIDPAWDGEVILAAAQKRHWRIGHLWFTHAHFDHIGGAGAIADALNPLPLVALHPGDHTLWRAEGGAPLFGFKIDPGPEPGIDFEHGQILQAGEDDLRGAAYARAYSRPCGPLLCRGGGLFLRRPDFPGQRRAHGSSRR